MEDIISLAKKVLPFNLSSHRKISPNPNLFHRYYRELFATVFINAFHICHDHVHATLSGCGEEFWLLKLNKLIQNIARRFIRGNSQNQVGVIAEENVQKLANNRLQEEANPAIIVKTVTEARKIKSASSRKVLTRIT
jgi:hypothetical protein